jgi:hypothetical protein
MKKNERWLIVFLSLAFSSLLFLYHYIIHSSSHSSNASPARLSKSSTTAFTVVNDPQFHVERRVIPMNSTPIRRPRHEIHSGVKITPQRRFVAFDWPLDSDYVSYLTYKSYESFLACCYTDNTQIEIMILGPNKANYYKVSKLLR